MMYDRRRKLTDSQRAEILIRYQQGESVNGLAKDFNVSRRTIHIICRPEVKQLLNERAIEYRKEHPISKELARARVKATREWQRRWRDEFSNNDRSDGDRKQWT